MQLYKQIKILIYTDLLNFTTKCSGCQMKAFSLLFFCTTSDTKSTKGGEC